MVLILIFDYNEIKLDINIKNIIKIFILFEFKIFINN